MEEESRQKALNELFSRLQQFELENKQLIHERARANEKVDALTRALAKAAAELDAIKNNNDELIKAVRAAIKKEMSPKKAKQ